MGYEDRKELLDEQNVPLIGPSDAAVIPPPPPNWRDSVPTLTNIATYKGKPNVLFADEETGDLIRYGMHGEEVERTTGQIPIKVKPPGARPDNSQLTAIEFVKAIDPQLKKDAEEYSKERVADYLKNFSAIDDILMTPTQLATRKAKVAEIQNEAYNSRYTQGQTLARTEAERRARAEEAERVRKEKDPVQATEWGLRERAAKGDLVAIAALKQMVGEKKAEDDLRREISDKDLYKPVLNKLPETKQEAVQAHIRIEKYKHLKDLANQGAGGLIPGLKAFLAPVGEAMGMDVTKLSEAQVYQLMARAAVGSQRLMLVGSGQVSNYEQDLMQRLSGGSIKTSREAARKLFDFYIKESKGIVDAYNTQLDSISSKFPDAKNLYGYVGRGSVEPQKTQGHSQKDLEFTARKYGITVDEVKRRLEAKGNK